VTKLINSNEIYLSSQFFGLERGLNYSLHRREIDHLGVNLAFCAFSLPVTIAVFLLLRIFSRFSFSTKMLRTIAGVMVVAVPPTCLWFVEWYRDAELYRGCSWLCLEGFIAVGFASLYAFNRWPISAPVTVTLLTVHSALWLHAYSATFEVFAFCWLTAPIIGYFSTLTWGYYVQRFRQQQTAPHELPQD
jgi:hypothetical protein